MGHVTVLEGMEIFEKVLCPPSGYQIIETVVPKKLEFPQNLELLLLGKQVPFEDFFSLYY